MYKRQVQSKDGVELSGGDIHTEEGRLIEAFSFYYARLVICASEDERLLARWAQAEAARAEHLLIRDSQNLANIANTYISVLEQSQQGQSNQRGMVATDIQSPSAVPRWIGMEAWSCRLHRSLSTYHWKPLAIAEL